MLEVQRYLQSGKTLSDLTQELGIRTTVHDTLPLVILNYNQIESPKTHPIVRECRGVVLNQDNNYSLVANCMRRFFNWGEVQDEMGNFDWSTCETTEKADGSLCLIYYFNGDWHANTRGSFAYGNLFNDEWTAKYFDLPYSFTWRDGFLRALGLNSLQELNLDKKLTYIAEFTSPWNKVVREYSIPTMYLITCFDGEEEVGPQMNSVFCSLERYPLHSANEVTQFVHDHPEATYEGVVIKDAAHRRWKIKNPRYLSLSHMKGNGDGFKPKHLLPYILKGDEEVLVYFKEAEPIYREIEGKVNTWKKEVIDLWHEAKDLPTQKDFALKVKDHRLSGLLFTARKLGKNVTEVFENSVDILEKQFH